MENNSFWENEKLTDSKGHALYYWYAITLRPGMGVRSFENDSLNNTLKWLKKQATSLFVVEEKEGREAHWHISICLKHSKTRSAFQSLYGSQVIDNVLGIKPTINGVKNPEWAQQTGEGPFKIQYNMDFIHKYLGGDYKSETKDKSIDYHEIIFNHINEGDIIKLRDIVKTTTNNRNRKKWIDILREEWDNYSYKNDPPGIDGYFNHLILDGKVSELIPLHAERRLKILFFNTLNEMKYMTYTSWKDLGEYYFQTICKDSGNQVTESF